MQVSRYRNLNSVLWGRIQWPNKETTPFLFVCGFHREIAPVPLLALTPLNNFMVPEVQACTSYHIYLMGYLTIFF